MPFSLTPIFFYGTHITQANVTVNEEHVSLNYITHIHSRAHTRAHTHAHIRTPLYSSEIQILQKSPASRTRLAKKKNTSQCRKLGHPSSYSMGMTDLEAILPERHVLKFSTHKTFAHTMERNYHNGDGSFALFFFRKITLITVLHLINCTIYTLTLAAFIT